MSNYPDSVLRYKKKGMFAHIKGKIYNTFTRSTAALTRIRRGQSSSHH